MFCSRLCSRIALKPSLTAGGASELAVDTCLWPVWNTGCLCGNEYYRLCRIKIHIPHSGINMVL